VGAPGGSGSGEQAAGLEVFALVRYGPKRCSQAGRCGSNCGSVGTVCIMRVCRGMAVRLDERRRGLR